MEIIHQSLSPYRHLQSISQWGYQFDGDKLAGYRPIPSEIFSVLALPLADSLLHLSLITSAYQVSPTVARWADSIIFIHLEGSALLSGARDGRLHRQASLRPLQSVTLSIQHFTRYRIRLTAAQPVVTLMFAALRSDVVTKYLKRVPTFPPFVTINCLKFGVRGPPVNNRSQNDASRFSP